MCHSPLFSSACFALREYRHGIKTDLCAHKTPVIISCQITNLEMLFILLIVVHSLSVTNEQNTEKFFVKDNCVNLQTIEIMKSYFSSRQCLSIIYLTQKMYVPNEYFFFSNLPQVVRKQNENEYRTITTLKPRRDFLTPNGTIAEFCEERLEGFILFSPNLQMLNSYAFSNIVSAFMNPRAYIFIHVRESFTAEELSPIFMHLWHVYRTPHITVTCCTCSHVFTPSAELPGGVATHTLDNVVVDISEINKKLYQLHGLSFRTCMFPSVMATALYSDTGVVEEYEGVDRMMVDLLAERMNFTKVLVSPANNETFGRRKSNGSFDGALGLLVTGSVDMASVGFFSMDYQTRDVEPTQGVQVDDLCAVVHKAKEVPPWLAPVRYIGFEICVALSLVYLGVAGVWITIRRFEIPKRKCDASKMFFDTFRLMLTTSVPRLSDTTGERVFLAFCSVAFVTFAGTFQGSLVTVYSTQFFYKDVNTLADLADTQLPILTRFESFKNDIFTNESSASRAKLKDMVQVYSGNISINTMVTETGTVGGLARRSSMDLDSQVLLFQDNKGGSLLHLVKECIRTYNIAYMLPRASAFAIRINEIILRASQAGLFEKWYQDMAVNNTKCRGSSKIHSQSHGRNQGENVPLSLEDLQLAMYELGVGMFVSLLAFVFETFHVHFWIQLRCVFTRKSSADTTNKT